MKPSPLREEATADIMAARLLSTFYILSNSSLLLKKLTMMMLIIERTMITTIGIGSSSSFTNGAPIVIDFDTKIIILVAVAFLLNGRTLSS